MLGSPSSWSYPIPIVPRTVSAFLHAYGTLVRAFPFSWKTIPPEANSNLSKLKCQVFWTDFLNQWLQPHHSFFHFGRDLATVWMFNHQDNSIKSSQAFEWLYHKDRGLMCRIHLCEKVVLELVTMLLSAIPWEYIKDTMYNTESANIVLDFLAPEMEKTNSHCLDYIAFGLWCLVAYIPLSRWCLTIDIWMESKTNLNCIFLSYGWSFVIL